MACNHRFLYYFFFKKGLHTTQLEFNSRKQEKIVVVKCHCTNSTHSHLNLPIKCLFTLSTHTHLLLVGVFCNWAMVKTDYCKPQARKREILSYRPSKRDTVSHKTTVPDCATNAIMAGHQQVTLVKYRSIRTPKRHNITRKQHNMLLYQKGCGRNIN